MDGASDKREWLFVDLFCFWGFLREGSSVGGLARSAMENVEYDVNFE
jgi:hypothetical protein